MEWVPDLSRG